MEENIINNETVEVTPEVVKEVEPTDTELKEIEANPVVVEETPVEPASAVE